MRPMKKRLTPKKTKFVELLAQGEVPREAGLRIGISKSTAYRWLNDPSVRTALIAIQRNGLETIRGRLMAAGIEASRTLTEVCRDDSQPAYVRCGAAKAIIDSLLKLHDVLITQEKIAEFEERLQLLEERKDVQ